MSRTYAQHLDAIDGTERRLLDEGFLRECKFHGVIYEAEFLGPGDIEERFAHQTDVDLDYVRQVLKDAPPSCPLCAR